MLHGIKVTAYAWFYGFIPLLIVYVDAIDCLKVEIPWYSFRPACSFLMLMSSLLPPCCVYSMLIENACKYITLKKSLCVY
jgi:hypothetical protein